MVLSWRHEAIANHEKTNSPFSQIWSACQLAVASFRFYYGIWKVDVSADSPSKTINPVLLGDAPEILLETPRIKEASEVDGSPSMLLKVQICDVEIDLPLLILAEMHGQVSLLLRSLEKCPTL
jgi:hypothetical protein